MNNLDCIFRPVQTAPQDSKPVKKLKLILGSETKKTSPFIERRDGDKGHFSLEKDGEIETRPSKPTGKIIPNEKYDITQQEKFPVYPPEIYDKLTQPSKTNKGLIIPSITLNFGRIKLRLLSFVAHMGQAQLN